MADVTGEEFKVFIDIMSKLKVLGNEHQQLVDLITEQAELDSTLQVSRSCLYAEVYIKVFELHRQNVVVWCYENARNTF